MIVRHLGNLTINLFTAADLGRIVQAALYMRTNKLIEVVENKSD
jgi:hypothetical protein